MDENAMEDVAPQIFILHGNDHHLHVELAVITELYRALFLYSDGSLLWHLHDDVARDSLATGKWFPNDISGSTFAVGVVQSAC